MLFKQDVNFESAFRPFITVQISSEDFSEKVSFRYPKKPEWVPDLKLN